MGLICLQGGDEFTPACRAMDTTLLDAAHGGPVAILPLASAPGYEYDSAAADAVRHFTGLGATHVTVADPAAPHEAAATAALLVLPGGSPRRLRDAVYGTPVGEAIRDAADDPDRVVMGASAGAMLLCAWTVLPENGLTVAEGLGVIADFGVVPHYAGPRPPWETALLDKGVDVLGIPEWGGVLIDGADVTAVGAEAATLVTDEGRERLAL